MSKARKLSLKLKLPLIMVALTATFLVTVSFLVYSMAEKSIREFVYSAKETAAKSGAQALTFMVDSARKDLSVTGTQPTVFRAINNFDRVYGMIEEEPVGFLLRHYVEENPHAVNEREKLVDPGDGSYYSQSHATYHPTFLQSLQINGYEDLYLLNASGQLMYSVKKRPDFIQQFGSGANAETGLGQVYAAALNATVGEVVTSDFASYAPGGGQAGAFLGTPIFNKKKEIIGVLAVQLSSQSAVTAMTSNLDANGSQDVFLVDQNGIARSPSLLSESLVVGDALPETTQVTAAKAGDGGLFEDARSVTGENVIALVKPLKIDGFNWSMVLETDATAAFAKVNEIRLVAVLMIGASVVIAILVSFVAARSVTRPILALREVTNALASENYSVDITGRNRGDELGDLASSLATFRDKLVIADEAAEREEEAARKTAAVVQKMSDALAELQRGNLACDISEPFDSHYETLRENFNQSLAILRGSMTEVVEAAHNVNRFSEEQRGSAAEMAHRTETQAGTLEETAGALKDLTVGIRATADNAGRVDDTMRGTRSEAEQSNHIVTSAVEAMDQIQEASQQISQIINMIDDIAFQTNLLALNAGVEAARAGEAGAGFAVVAAEVRALAMRASKAAGEIKDLTTASEEHVANGVAMVGRAGAALTSIIEKVGDVSGLITEIADGVQKQSSGLQNINDAMNRLDSTTQQNAAMSEEAAAASQLLQNEAQSLTGVVSRFQLDGGGGQISASAHEAADVTADDWTTPGLAQSA
ncbi:methyl-accepting chemotaxis protein [Phaeobacter sp.]|uniref:methyl-accepting chemotaxis protein n=1 Tax=Phaeobacter sp. TaxID=1902409 RepID=UPI0025D10BF2|nr:methyl-accepting chemotaxis protein [Phaeobacter sp.]